MKNSSSSSKQPRWRMVKFNRGRSGMGTACAEVKIGEHWHKINIAMGLDGFRALAAMPDRARYLLLDSLATMPVRHGTLDNHQGGLHDKAALLARFNAQWLGFAFLDFFKGCTQLTKLHPRSKELGLALTEMAHTGIYGKITKQDEFYKRIISIHQKTLDAMRSESYVHRSPRGMAAYLIEKLWRMNHGQWPSALLPPTEDPDRFFKVIKRTNPFTGLFIPKALDQLIEDILADRSCPLLIPDTVHRPLFMTDFTIY